jgi:hypothetical protein
MGASSVSTKNGIAPPVRPETSEAIIQQMEKSDKLTGNDHPETGINPLRSRKSLM